MKTTHFELAMSEIIEVPGVDRSHPFTTIARFIFADDKPNQNGQAINVEEFASIAASSIGMPVKMRFDKEIEKVGGHPGSIPIGVIRKMDTNTLEDGTNQLVAEAVLWADEYPDEVEFLREAFAGGKAPGVSWELGYKSSLLENGISWLKNVITRAATFVESPAYGTRTALLALAGLNEPEDIKKGIIALAELLTLKEVCAECSHTSDCTCETCECTDSHIVSDAAIDKNVGGGVDRKKIPTADFAGKDKSFPIVTPADVADAAQSIGRAGNDNYSADELKSRIIAIAKRKGSEFIAKLPDSWKTTQSESSIQDDEGGKKMEEELKEAKAQLEAAKADLIAKAQEVAAKEAELSVRDTKISDLESRVSELTKANTTETRIRKFTEAGLKLDAEADKAEKKKEFIASLTDAQWTEYLDEKVADLKAVAEAIKAKPTDFALAAASARQGFPRVEIEEPETLASLRSFMRELHNN